MKVKICANKTIEDAKMSLAAGADIIGVLVGQEHVSNDFVDEFKAKEICDFVDGKCDVSLVTHLKDAEEIIRLTKFIGNNIIQLHSNIDEKEVKKINKALPKIKFVRLIHLSKDGEICSNLKDIKIVDYFLMDSFNLSTNQVGGTGITYNWIKAGEIIKKLKKPVFLAGGLSPENVQTAINQANPYGVDVNSGCKLNGIKNIKKVKDFVANAKWNKIKAVIFDFDGTFFSGSVWSGWKNYLDMFIDKYLNGEERFKQVVTNKTNGVKMADIMIKEKGTAEEFYNFQRDILYNIEANDLVVVKQKLINELSKKCKLFIVSNSHYNYLIFHLEKFGIDKNCFTEIIDNKFKTNDLTKTEYYLNILRKYNLDPQTVLVVGDSFNSDILPALSLKLQVRLINDANETNEVIDDLLNKIKGV